MIKLRNLEKSIKQGQGQLFLLRRIDLDRAGDVPVRVRADLGSEYAGRADQPR